MKPRYAIRTSSRVVFLTPNRVYKIPVNLRGWLQGLNERKVWKGYKDTGRLAPLLWGLGGIVCMERVAQLEYVDKKTVALLKRLIPQLNIERCDLHNPANWGYYHNRPVLLDYGVSERVAAMY